MARKPRSRRARAQTQGGGLRIALVAAAVLALAAAGALAWAQMTAQDAPRSAPASAKNSGRQFPKGPVLDRSAPACGEAAACLHIIDNVNLSARDWNAAIAQMAPKSTADPGVLACAKASRDTIPKLCALSESLTTSTALPHLQVLARIAEAAQPEAPASAAAPAASSAATDVTAGGGSAGGASITEDATGGASPASNWLKANAASIAAVMGALALALAALTAFLWWRVGKAADGRSTTGDTPEPGHRPSGAFPSSQESETMTGAYPGYQRGPSRPERDATIDALENRLAALDQRLASVERQATLREEALAQRLAKVEQDARQREGAYREALESAVRDLKALIDKTDHRVEILQKYRGAAAPEPRIDRGEAPADGYDAIALRLQQAGLRIAPPAFVERARTLEAEFSQHAKLGAQPQPVRRALSVVHATAAVLAGGLNVQHQAPLDALFGELAGPGYGLIWPAVNSTVLDGEHIAVRREGEIGNQIAAVIAPGLRKVEPGGQAVLLLAQVAVH